jgi:hypothetical protein
MNTEPKKKWGKINHCTLWHRAALVGNLPRTTKLSVGELAYVESCLLHVPRLPCSFVCIMLDELIFARFPFFLEHEARRLSRVSKEQGATSLDLPVSKLCIGLVSIGYIPRADGSVW